jgi:hypothetical protein
MMEDKNVSDKPRVTQSEIGLYIRTVELDYIITSNQELADLITHYFGVICLEEDVIKYKNPTTDWELESRRADYFNAINRINPYL